MGVKLKIHGECDNYAFRSMQFYKSTKLSHSTQDKEYTFRSMQFYKVLKHKCKA